MLSKIDIAKELGKGIIIYPFISENFEGSSIYLTASDLAWSINKKMRINSGNKIIIPAHDVAVIITNEVISLDGRYAGVCHARVSLVALGLGHISTPLKPGTKDKLIISIPNNTDKDVPISLGGRIAVVMIYKLRTKIKKYLAEDRAPLDRLGTVNINVALGEKEEFENSKKDELYKSALLQYKNYKKDVFTKFYKFIDFLPFLLTVLTGFVLLFYCVVSILNNKYEQLINIIIPLFSLFFGITMGKKISN